MNGDHFKNISGYPEIIHGDIETQDLDKLGTFIKDMVGIGAITPDEKMEDYLRMTASLPERDFTSTYMGDNQTANKQKPPAPAVGDNKQDEPDFEE